MKIKLYGHSGALVAAGALLLCGAVYYSQAYAAPSPEELASQTFWREQILTKGSEAAYAYLAETVAGGTYLTQHGAAHAFGAALYKVEGPKAYSICDAQFSYGCSHEFLGQAIADGGFSSVSSLNAACIEKFGERGLVACQHGIGHGLVSSIGYEYENMTDALEVCKTLPRLDQLTGCYGGVFMEYNVRTMLGEDAGVRELSEGLFSPCDTVSSSFAPACALRMPQWWNRGMLHGDLSVQAFERMGELCRNLADVRPETMSACFQGVGLYLSGEVDYVLERIGMLCDAASNTTQEEVLCRSTAASATVLGGKKTLAESVQLCGVFTGDEYAFCVTHAGDSTYGPRNTQP